MNQKQIEEIDGMDPQQHQEEERIFMIYNLRGKLNENACSTAQQQQQPQQPQMEEQPALQALWDGWST